jgi:hypothetical protein
MENLTLDLLFVCGCWPSGGADEFMGRVQHELLPMLQDRCNLAQMRGTKVECLMVDVLFVGVSLVVVLMDF